MAGNAPFNCTTLPADQPFLESLARFLLQTYGNDPQRFIRMLVLLPNRRACRALREAFLVVTNGKPLLLPRIQPIGDIDEETLLPYHLIDGIPPAISPLRRELLLTRIVTKFGDKRYGIEQAAQLARSLAEFLDDVAREGLTFDSLASLVPEELAQHWQETVDFLAIITRDWPKILAEEGVFDPATHRNLILAATAEAWSASPPDFPIVAAGSTGSIPATAKLLGAIARLPHGTVILPGFDTGIPESDWELIEHTHPQYALKKLLESMGCKKENVCPAQNSNKEIPRIAALRAIFEPPEATAHWSENAAPLTEGLANIHLMAADTLLDEARMIAIALRETLETPEKTAALITPDRSLARMVASQMQRFGTPIDDSAGQSLLDTPVGCFLRLVMDVAASRVAPAPLLALLRHPLAAMGLDTAECREFSRELEMHLLRGIRHSSGFAALHEAAKPFPKLQKNIARLMRIMQPLMQCFEKKSCEFSQLIQVHFTCAEMLAQTTTEEGSQRLWAKDSGEAMAAFFAELLPHAALLNEIDTSSYGALFDVLLAPEIVRPRHGLHPRLHILSPIEARLLHFDRVILGGLNEGTWPAPPAADPWMSRPMRERFGLPPSERSVGQSAHDVFMLCAAPEVILSRARKVEGSPTVPSRWLVRLETLIKGLSPDDFARMQVTDYYARGKALLDAPLETPALSRPEPAPPMDVRPRRLRVTAIDTWLRDPYMIYAAHILGLKKLEELDEEPGAADFGTLVHKAMEAFTRQYPQALPANPMGVLLASGHETFAVMLERPAIASVWWPRFEAMALWLSEQEIARRGALHQVFAEVEGVWEFSAGGKPFTLTTHIDRLEIGKDGTVTIIDYKTGFVPSKSDIEKGLANQLFLEAIIALEGKLSLSAEIKIGVGGIRLEYWKLSGNPDVCEIIAVDAAAMEASKQRLLRLIEYFDNANVPYASPLDPSLVPHYNDFEHLTRRQEWQVV